MKIDHIAVASNSEKESDKFFCELLKLKKIKTFTVSEDLSQKFFGVKKAQKVVRYQNESFGAEVFITEDSSKAKDVFTHTCIIIQNREELIKKALEIGFETIKVTRKEGDSYYLFLMVIIIRRISSRRSIESEVKR